MIKNIFLIIISIIIWVLSIYFLARLYIRLLKGRSDIKNKKGFENRNITFLKWLVLVIVSFLSVLSLLSISIILFILGVVITGVLFFISSNLVGSDTGYYSNFHGHVLYSWDWWILSLIEKKKN